MPVQYVKPQSPLFIGDKYFYPLTTADQVIMPDGSRLSQKDTNDSPFIFIGTNESFPSTGETGKFYIKNNYIYIWNGSSFEGLAVQAVNGKTGEVTLTAIDVGAIANPTDLVGVEVGDSIIVKNLINGRVEIGFKSSKNATAGFIEFSEENNIPVEERKIDTLYGLQLRVLTEADMQSYSSGGDFK